MASGEPTLIEQRRISGKGIIKVPDTNANVRRFLTLVVQVVRFPKNKYMNANYNPNRSRYGTIVYLRNSAVVGTDAIEFEEQAFDFVADISGQVLYAVQCSYEGVLKSFANLGEALGLNVLSVTNNIKDWKALDLLWDEARVVCYADTALDLFLFQGEYDVCPEQEPQPQKPPLPLPPPERVPPGTPLSGSDAVSFPYESPNDDGNSIPYPGDNTPTQTTCNIIYNYQDLYIPSQSGNNRVSTSFMAYTPITIGTPVYSMPGSDPPGSFKRSSVVITDALGITQSIILVNNSVSGHLVSNLRSPCT